MTVRIVTGDALTELRKLPSESVHCCVTSPPYYGLRDYGVAGQIGLEPSPAEYIAALVAVFREVRRVLRKDGTAWVNLGMSYAGGGTVGRNDTNPEDLARRAAKYGTGTGPGSAVGSQGSISRGVGGKRPSQSRLPERALACGSDDKEPGGLLGLGSACSDPGDVDQAGSRCHYVRNVGSGRLTQQSQPPSVLTARDSERSGSAVALACSEPRDVQASTTPASLPNAPVGAGREDAVLEVRTTDLTSPDGVPASAHTAPYSCGSEPPASALRSQDKDAWGLACRCGSCGFCFTRLATSALRFKPKDEINTPHLLALALQADGWYLRQTICWSKPNPMPESVTDRCTKAHEYLFLLSKSERYYYDAAAIAEVQSSAGNGGFTNKATLKSVRLNASHAPSLTDATNDGLRNKRSVWEVATQPLNEWGETVRQMRVEADAPADGKKRKASPDCPVHAGQSGSAPTASYGGRAAARSSRSGRSDVDRGPALPLGCAPIETRHEQASAQRNSGSLDPSCSSSATRHSTESRRTGPAPETSLACSASAQTHDHIGGIEVAREPYGSAERTPENNTSEGGLPAGLSAQTQRHIERITSDAPTRCTCEWYVEIVEKTSHFATFPPALIEPCILAGCPRGGAVLDPFGGAGTTGLVADRLGRDAILIELNPGYAEMAERRIHGDAPLFSDVAVTPATDRSAA